MPCESLHLLVARDWRKLGKIMKHLLYSAAFGLIGLSFATSAAAQYEVDTSPAAEKQYHTVHTKFTTPYDEKTYEQLIDAFLKAETRCLYVGDDADKATINNAYAEQNKAGFALHLMAMSPDTPVHIRDKYIRDFAETQDVGSYIVVDHRFARCGPKIIYEDNDSGGVDLSDAFFDRNWTATASVSREIRDVPQSGYGVRILPTTEEFAALTAHSLTGIRYQFGLENVDLGGDGKSNSQFPLITQTSRMVLAVKLKTAPTIPELFIMTSPPAAAPGLRSAIGGSTLKPKLILKLTMPRFTSLRR
jgi:hypothetical protein